VEHWGPFYSVLSPRWERDPPGDVPGSSRPTWVRVSSAPTPLRWRCQSHGIIGAGTRVEHYEMAGYMTAISLAQSIGAKDVVALLQKSLAEEQAAEQKPRSIGSGLMKSTTAAKA
jgi:Domain of unknown function (DUF892)